MLYAIPLVLFVWIGLNGIISHFPDYDEAYNASVAKNIVAGLGYSTSYDRLILFNPEITTGPNLIVPAAVLIGLFGNNYWAPALSSLIISSMLMLIILMMLYRHLAATLQIDLKKKKDWLILLLIFLILTLFWLPDIRDIKLLGEIPSALFVCAGILIIFLPAQKRSDIFGGGLLLGLAITSKSVTLIFVIVIQFMWLLFQSVESKQNGIKENRSSQFLLSLGIILPIASFELVKLISLGMENFLSVSLRELTQFMNLGSGVDRILFSGGGLLPLLFQNFRINFSVLQGTPFGIFRFIFFLVILALMIVFSIRKIIQRKSFSVTERLAMSSVLAVAAYLIWWLIFSSAHWYRHVLPAMVMISFASVIALIVIFRRRVISAPILVFFFWVLIYPAQWAKVFEKADPPTELINATINTADFLLREKEQGKSALGCGWWTNRRLEYFMPESLNFHDCLNASLQNSDLVIDREYWNFEKSREIIEIEKQCSQLIFEDAPYEVYQCTNKGFASP